ncbi:MAG: hypothetical protein LBF22_04170 [Deltaproteobacteria bacterium]|jgi:hypothetical protein|nr:hypothetical protein [Deltaproteobacteria bacterium]
MTDEKKNKIHGQEQIGEILKKISGKEVSNETSNEDSENTESEQKKNYKERQDLTDIVKSDKYFFDKLFGSYMDEARPELIQRKPKKIIINEDGTLEEEKSKQNSLFDSEMNSSKEKSYVIKGAPPLQLVIPFIQIKKETKINKKTKKTETEIKKIEKQMIISGPRVLSAQRQSVLFGLEALAYKNKIEKKGAYFLDSKTSVSKEAKNLCSSLELKDKNDSTLYPCALGNLSVVKSSFYQLALEIGYSQKSAHTKEVVDTLKNALLDLFNVSIVVKDLNGLNIQGFHLISSFIMKEKEFVLALNPITSGILLGETHQPWFLLNIDERRLLKSNNAKLLHAKLSSWIHAPSGKQEGSNTEKPNIKPVNLITLFSYLWPDQPTPLNKYMKYYRKKAVNKALKEINKALSGKWLISEGSGKDKDKYIVQRFPYIN